MNKALIILGIFSLILLSGCYSTNLPEPSMTDEEKEDLNNYIEYQKTLDCYGELKDNMVCHYCIDEENKTTEKYCIDKENKQR